MAGGWLTRFFKEWSIVSQRVGIVGNPTSNSSVVSGRVQRGGRMPLNALGDNDNCYVLQMPAIRACALCSEPLFRSSAVPNTAKKTAP